MRVRGIADASLRSTCLSEDLQERGSEDLESMQDRRKGEGQPPLSTQEPGRAFFFFFRTGILAVCCRPRVGDEGAVLSSASSVIRPQKQHPGWGWEDIIFPKASVSSFPAKPPKAGHRAQHGQRMLCSDGLCP